MRVLALDPGERVGWAAGEVHQPAGPKGMGGQRLVVTGHGMLYLKDMALRVYAELLRGEYDAVVYETWLLTAKGAQVSVGSDMQSSQFIGMVRLCCWIAGIPCYGQAPAAKSSAHKSLKNDLPGAKDVRERVARAEAVSHDDGHDGDALLHLWHHFFERYV